MTRARAITHAAEHLSTLADALEHDTDIPRDVRRWLFDAIGAYMAGDGTLDHCLGLSVGRGGAFQHVSRLLRQRRRDELVVRAAEGLQGSTHRRATTIAQAVREYGRRGVDHLPGDTGAAVTELVAAFGIEAPMSTSQIYRVLQGETCAARTFTKSPIV